MIDVTYPEAAVVLSLVIVGLYVAMIPVVARRAYEKTGKVEPVREYARRVEGPMVTGLAVISLILLISAISRISQINVDVLLLAGAGMRGVLLGIAILAWGYFWVERETWL